MSEMLESAGAALQSAWDDYPFGLPPIVFSDGEREHLCRAIIAELMEPTLEMLEAGRDAYRSTQRSGISGMTIDAQIRAECVREAAAFRAMISAAMQETDT
jgi:hypothetical protein